MVQDLSLTRMITVGVLVEEKIPQIQTVEEMSIQGHIVLYIPSPRVRVILHKNLILYKIHNIKTRLNYNEGY